jgi:hypothetical protein
VTDITLVVWLIVAVTPTGNAAAFILICPVAVPLTAVLAVSVALLIVRVAGVRIRVVGNGSGVRTILTLRVIVCPPRVTVIGILFLEIGDSPGAGRTPVTVITSPSTDAVTPVGNCEASKLIAPVAVPPTTDVPVRKLLLIVMVGGVSESEGCGGGGGVAVDTNVKFSASITFPLGGELN